jgi:hypothetical protein
LAALIPIFSGSAANAELSEQANTLKLITDTADRICNVIASAGSARDVDVQGQLKAELGGLASRLADIGVSGSGKLKDEQYQNVLRQDLAGLLRDNANCKYKVFENLSNKTLSPSSMNAPLPLNAPSAYPSPSPPVNIAGTWRDNWGTVTEIVQEGDVFRFSAVGRSCQGSYFQSSGRGTISGHNVESSYSSSLPSGGQCSGIVFPGGGEISSTCKDTVCGSFNSSSVRLNYQQR